MIIFSGNELIIGIIFVNWLLCIAIGSWVLGRLAERSSERHDWLVVTLIFTSLVLPLQIIFVRSMGSWLVERGEMVGLFPTFYSTFLALLPFCSLHGFQFTLGCRLLSDGGDMRSSTTQISRIYVFESLGSVIGGLAFSYLLVHHLRVLEMSVYLSIMNLSIAFFLLLVDVSGRAPSTLGRVLKVVTPTLLLVVCGSVVVMGGLGGFDAIRYRPQWEMLELIHTQNSIYGNIAITRSDGQLDFWVNGLPLFTAPDPDIEFIEDIVHFPMLQHPSPKSVLVIGGGLGGALHEVLKHPVDRVVYVELDPLLIKLAGRHSRAVSGVLEDPRVQVVTLDGRLFVKTAEASFDVAIVNLPPPSTLQLNRFYTLEFFRDVHEILEEGGVLSTVLPSSMAHMSEEMGALNRCIYETIRRVFTSCVVVPGSYNLFMASRSGGEGLLTYDSGILNQRLRERELETSLFTEDYIRYKFSPERREMGLAYLYLDHGEINWDMKPAAVYHDLALWNAMLNPNTRPLFYFLSQVNVWWLMMPLSVIIPALAVSFRRFRLVRPPVYLAIFTSGLAGMTLSIIIFYTFQTLCGYLYQELGVVAASFMLGLALGGWLMGRWISKLVGGVSAICKAEIAMVAYLLFIPLAITQISSGAPATSSFPLVRVFLSLLNCAAGFLVGLEFSLAGMIMLKGGGRVGRVAGTLYASDLFGACAGSLISSIWLVPLHGVVGACLVAAALNLASLILLYSTIRPG